MTVENNNPAENFEKLLLKYDFVNTIPHDIQRYALRSRKDILKIFKAAGRYSLYSAVLIKIYFLFRSLGIKAGFFTVKIFLFSSAVCLVSASSGGVYFAAHYLDRDRSKVIDGPVEKVVPGIDTKKDAGEKPDTGNRSIEKTEAVAAVGSFQGEGPMAQKLQQVLKKYLEKKLGRGTIDMVTSSGRSSAERVVTGSVRKQGDEYFILVKVIDVSSSKIMVVESAGAGRENFETVCRNIAKKIIPVLK